MSDTHHDDHGPAGDHEGAGHEIDRMPNARLFSLLFGLSGLTLLACIGVIQLFNMQVDALETSRAEQGSFRIVEYLDEMNKTKSGWGNVEVKELDDKNTTTVRWHMPLTSARKAVLDDPNQLKAFAPVGAWKTADEQAPAAAAKPGAPTDGAGMRPPMPMPSG
ncbi:MAG: hypothetical protein IAG13_22850, partial [Deltaproteobacteria bacterium]|nr:hypothetical protein [Nannocystaceae bacterium]